MNPSVEIFRDATSGTFSYLVYDEPGGHGLIIDPVLDFDPVAARTSTQSAEQILAAVARLQLGVDWILETHAHADHLSAGAWLRERTGAKLAIGRGIVAVQEYCRELFQLEPGFVADGSQFDRLLDDGDRLAAGTLEIQALATPGHTSDGLSYLIGDAVFVGDTLFAPDVGTARCDFPGGSAAILYGSIQRLLALPADTRLFLCHDYPPEGRAASAQTSIEAQRAANLHVGGGVARDEFVRVREGRDAKLPQPRLILPALQVNIRGGRLPPVDTNGVAYLRLPVNRIGTMP